MPAPRNRLVYPVINDAEMKRIGGLAAYNAARRSAYKLLPLAKDECPVDNRPSRPASRGSHMRDEHYVNYLGSNEFVLFVDKDYAMFVYDGAQGSAPNRWLTRALDRLKASSS